MSRFWQVCFKLSYKISRNPLRGLIRMQKSIKVHLPHYEIPQPSPHYSTTFPTGLLPPPVRSMDRNCCPLHWTTCPSGQPRCPPRHVLRPGKWFPHSWGRSTPMGCIWVTWGVGSVDKLDDWNLMMKTWKWTVKTAEKKQQRKNLILNFLYHFCTNDITM